MNELYLKLITVITKRMSEKNYLIKNVEMLQDNTNILLIVKTTVGDVYTYSINSDRARKLTLPQLLEHIWLWKYVRK